MSIDLHTHSNISDGILPPRELTRYAYNKKLKAFSLTDHDTVKGVYQAGSAAKKIGIEFVPGVEISAIWPVGKFHILGYYIDPENQILLNALERLRIAREQRNPKIIQKLNDLGMKISIEQVIEISGTGVTGRPHIARALIDNGYCESFEQAFNEYLDKGKPAYVPKEKIKPDEACYIIRKSGGVCVIAHPSTLGKNDKELKSTIKELKQTGFEGIEAIYSENTEEQNAFYLNIAKEFDMLVTGGSDFHNPEDKGIDMGCVKVDYEYLDIIKEYKKNRNGV